MHKRKFELFVILGNVNQKWTVVLTEKNFFLTSLQSTQREKQIKFSSSRKKQRSGKQDLSTML